MNVQSLHFRAIERARAATAKDNELVAGLIDGAVAIDALGDGEGRATSARRGNQLRHGAGTEAGEMRGIVFRRDDLQDAKSVAAIGDESKDAAGDHADFDVVDIIELTARSEELVEPRRFRPFGVNDGDSLSASGNIGISARDIDVTGVLERHKRVWNGLWPGEIGYVEDFEAIAIDDKGIAKLHGEAAGIVERRRSDSGGDARLEGIVEIDDDQSLLGQHVSVRSGDDDAARSCESAFRIEGERALQKIIGGIAIEKRANARAFRFQIRVADDDETFLAIGDIEEAVEQMDRLLFVFRKLYTEGIYAESGRGSNRDGIPGWHVETLAERGDRRGDDALGKALIVNVSDVVHAKAARAGRGRRACKRFSESGRTRRSASSQRGTPGAVNRCRRWLRVRRVLRRPRLRGLCRRWRRRCSDP